VGFIKGSGAIVQTGKHHFWGQAWSSWIAALELFILYSLNKRDTGGHCHRIGIGMAKKHACFFLTWAI
jgi:hypothetical protein